MNYLTVSKVAKASNVNIETIRYYERRGLISTPPRTESGYKKFSHDTVEDILFIKRAQEVGFTLEEIIKLLTVYKKEDYFPTEEMYGFAAAKVKEIEEKIRKLEKFKSLLEIVTTRSVSELPLSKDQCPVIKQLSEGGFNNG
ncbi:MAG: MerR family transcriptional regulator [Paenibacillus sp.]|nr:MerR family transcriptional regulator [Paenibacillus sp.]